MASAQNLKVLSRDEIFSKEPEWRVPGGSNYFSMYSSVFGGVVTDPVLMVLPVDDHMVHRGDGIFEAFKCVNGYIYNLGAHLARLQKSAELISLNLPFDLDTIRKIIIETVAIGGVRDCMIRLFVSRGLGGFDCAPKECPKSNLYVIAMEAWTAPDYFYTEGVSAITSKIPVKPAFFAQVKSCNYLPNVLVDMEAEQNKAEFAIMVDPEGYLAEAATENVAIVNEEKIFMYPKFNISREKAYKSSEMLLFGTGPNVLPIVKYDGKPIGTGKPGPVFRRLRELFQKDVKENKKVLTPCHRYYHLL